MRKTTRALLAALSLAGPTAAHAADLDYDFLRGSEYDPPASSATLLQTDRLTAEVFTGYVAGQAREYANSTAGAGRISQLNWQTNSLVVGGRVAFTPFDGVTVRARGWSAVASAGSMTDFDWFYGYRGSDSWSHYSQSPNSKPAKMWQGDLSTAITIFEDEGLKYYGVAGYRYFTFKSNARGGSYVYSSSAESQRDLSGSFPGGQLGIAYQQSWQTPYLGIGGKFDYDAWTAGAELIGSPVVIGNAKDHHALRGVVFKDNFSLTGMVGFDASLEYHVNPTLSVVGRAEYQNYFDTSGSEKAYSGGQLVGSFPKPAAGGALETLLVSVGVKARL